MTNEIIDPMEYFRNEIVGIINTILKMFKVEEDYVINLEPPPPGLGDFAFPCFNLAPILKKSPADIASELSQKIPEHLYITQKPTGPYLNFKIEPKKIAESIIPTIFSLSENYGHQPDNKTALILEHTSANPNGPFHVGRARNPILGDTLARIYRAGGYNVETQYWVNDMGKQTAIMTWGLNNFEENSLPAIENLKPDHDVVRYYQAAAKAIEDDPAIENKIGELLLRFERGDKELSKQMRDNCERVLSGMKQSLARLNIFVDRYVYESQVVIDGSVYKIIENLKKSKYTSQDDGAYYLDLEEFNIHGRTSRFVFTRKDGTSLYTTRDLAYHSYKLNNCDIALNILGEDHKLQSRMLSIALDLLGHKKLPEVVFYSFVSLPEGRMSTRKSRVVYLDDLMDEAAERALVEVKARREDLHDEEKRKIAEQVGIGAIRYNIIRVQAEKKIVFRWEDALNFEGDSAPFIQYAHARACSILRKANEENIVYQKANFEIDAINNDYEFQLIRILGKLPGMVNECIDKKRPHLLAGYAHELAAEFNQFYRECPVLTAEHPDLIQSRLCLVDATRIVIKNTLELLGISAPEKM